MNRKASILILNYSGKELLEEYLPSVIEALEYDGNKHESVVVDNLSTDDSVEFVERNFHGVAVRRMDSNYWELSVGLRILQEYLPRR